MSSTDTSTSTSTSTSTDTDSTRSADRELKAKHRALWALGDYTSVATDVIAALGPILVAATGIGPADPGP